MLHVEYTTPTTTPSTLYIDATHRAPSVVSTNVHNYTMGMTAPD